MKKTHRNMILRTSLVGLFVALAAFALWPGAKPTPTDLSSQTLTMAQFEQQCLQPKDEIWVIDFWASWCGPCIQSIPRLRELHQKYKDKGVRLISISVDERETDWKRMLEIHPMPWEHLLHPDLRNRQHYINRHFRFNAIPTLFVIDKQGKAKRFAHPEDVDQWLAKQVNP
jgi:thiol-disulfide isomerase/thioredoxin